jgi:hypothetical protein
LRFMPAVTRYCLPPVLITAYMADLLALNFGNPPIYP